MYDLSAVAGQLQTLLNDALDERNTERWWPKIPTGSEIDLTIPELCNLVGTTANVYSQASRFAALASAEHKRIKGAYDRKYKQAKGMKAPNADAREAAAMAACRPEHEALITIESVLSLASGLESAARIASESARKLLGAATSSSVLGRSDYSIPDSSYS